MKNGFYLFFWDCSNIRCLEKYPVFSRVKSYLYLLIDYKYNELNVEFFKKEDSKRYQNQKYYNENWKSNRSKMKNL